MVLFVSTYFLFLSLQLKIKTVPVWKKVIHLTKNRAGTSYFKKAYHFETHFYKLKHKKL